ncbi:hypothetical protein [Solidesulfovibrio sp. C21]|uniref:hypothetical protein n=1 Tax=Solidesulfovibrio sp. C21 TaxID=3398613 RepID=UPI0039FD7F35
MGKGPGQRDPDVAFRKIVKFPLCGESDFLISWKRKGNLTSPKGKSSYAGPGKNSDSNWNMPPGQQKKQSKQKKKKHRNAPPDQAPAWGYRNQE